MYLNQIQQEGTCTEGKKLLSSMAAFKKNEYLYGLPVKPLSLCIIYTMANILDEMWMDLKGDTACLLPTNILLMLTSLNLLSSLRTRVMPDVHSAFIAHYDDVDGVSCCYIWEHNIEHKSPLFCVLFCSVCMCIQDWRESVYLSIPWFSHAIIREEV